MKTMKHRPGCTCTCDLETPVPVIENEVDAMRERGFAQHAAAARGPAGLPDDVLAALQASEPEPVRGYFGWRRWAAGR